MKKKLLGVLLASTLIVGAVGSYAWFSDNSEVNSDIKLTMGTLDVKVTEDGDGWKIVDKTSEIINKDATKHFKNVRPGDSFQRNFYISNTGTLKQNVTVKLNPEVANKVVAKYNGKKIKFNELFNLTFDLDASPLSEEKGSEVKFMLDSVYTEEEGINPSTSAKNMTVNLEINKDAMDNRFNHEGNKFVQVFDFLKDKSVPLVIVEAEQVNKE
ncbi:TasA family protein [Clostridium sp.]|uniref:TasA family protein n=1 Tax=Clostridium sp. TaxID=1506 RepID=UPI002608D817